MAWIQWGDTPKEHMLVIRTKLQDHEDLLLGNPEADIKGVVPIVNRAFAKADAWKQLGIVLQGLILIGIAIIGVIVEGHK